MDLMISQMMQMQRDLFDAQGRKWAPMEPEYGGEFFLYMVEEIGEVISIWKKKGERAIVDDPSVRSAFLEEMADVLMYYNEVLLRFHVTPEEISQAYQDKHDRNMTRNYQKQYEEMLTDGKN
jgi:NTP pyrophosphatase (non-canonical NTP hydrolase)